MRKGPGKRPGRSLYGGSGWGLRVGAPGDFFDTRMQRESQRKISLRAGCCKKQPAFSFLRGPEKSERCKFFGTLSKSNALQGVVFFQKICYATGI